MLQILPGAEDEMIDIIEKKLQQMPKLTEMLEEGMTPEDIAKYVLGDLELKIYDKTDINFVCDCSYEKVEKVLMTVGREELTDILEKDKQAELNCHFCNKKYMFTEDKLKELLERI